MTEAYTSEILDRAKIALKKSISSHLASRRMRMPDGEYFRFHLDNPSDQCLVLMAGTASRHREYHKVNYIVLVTEFDGVSTDSLFQDNYTDLVTSIHGNLDQAFEEFWRRMQLANPGRPD